MRTHYIVLLSLAACAEPETEVDNPRQYRVLAEHHGPDGVSVHQSYGFARCSRWRCDLSPDEVCECDGEYRITGSQGLDLAFRASGIGRGTLTSEDGAFSAAYKRRPGSGQVVVTRVSQLDQGGREYAVDLAGGFTVEVGPHRFVRGVFYSIETDR